MAHCTPQIKWGGGHFQLDNCLKLQDIFQGSSSAETIYHKNESKDVFQAASSVKTIYHKHDISLDTFLPF